jgi:hypothetical protein
VEVSIGVATRSVLEVVLVELELVVANDVEILEERVVDIVLSLVPFDLCLVIDVGMLFGQVALCAWQGMASQVEKRMVEVQIMPMMEKRLALSLSMS